MSRPPLAGPHTAARAPRFLQSVLDRAKAAAGVLLGPVSHNDYPPAAEGGLNPSGECASG